MKLADILNAAQAESDGRRRKTSLKSLKQRIRDLPPALGFARHLAARRFSIVAEVKTKSPSMGRMNFFAEHAALNAHRIYDKHPIVAAISVLTQHEHFGGSEQLLRRVRRETRKPILRKDFVRDEYEVYYSRMIGADAILLMANVVTDRGQFAALHDLATDLGLDVLCEVHSAKELDVLPPDVKVLGINSRKFESSKRFFWSRFARQTGRDVSIDLKAFELHSRLPPACLKIAESGVTPDNFRTVLTRYNFDAALVGTSLLSDGASFINARLDELQSLIAEAGRDRSRRGGIGEGLLPGRTRELLTT